MNATIRFLLQVTILLIAFPAVLASQAVQGRGTRSKPHARIEIGEIVGAEYDPTANRFLIYAAPPARQNAAVLRAEDVIILAAVVYRFGGFDFSLERGPRHLEIHYFPPQAGEQLARLLRGSEIEATFSFTDRILKELGHGEKVGEGLRTGASELLLCRTELCQPTATIVPDFTTVYVAYFELDVDPSTEGLRVWFREPSLRVRAATRREDMPLPECVKRFAENLSSNAEQLLADRKIGAEFRRLKTLLLAAQALGWARRAFVPVDVARLEEYVPIRNSPAQRIPIKEYPILCRDPSNRDRVRNFSVHGGIALHPEGLSKAFLGQEAEPERRDATPASAGDGIKPKIRAKPGRQGFHVEPIVLNGCELLRIDMSGCLGLEGRN